jgi:RyR domain
MMPAGTDINAMAKVCHEANRAYCQTLGDYMQPEWEYAPEWQIQSARNGVAFHLNELEHGRTPAPSASHEHWLAEKRADGWKYGPVKNPETKEHPCFVPYEELPLDQRRKDYLFAAICKAFADSAQAVAAQGQ